MRKKSISRSRSVAANSLEPTARTKQDTSLTGSLSLDLASAQYQETAGLKKSEAAASYPKSFQPHGN